jgi:PAS domain-containing protein
MPTQSLRLLLTALALLCGAMLAVGVALGHGLARPSAAWMAGVAGVGLALALAVRQLALKRLSGLLAHQEVEHQAESLRFHTAINNMSQGLCFFDGQQRLIVCNQRYAEMYRLSIEQVRPGTTLRDIVDHRYASGCMPKMTREAYLAWRDSIAVADKPSNTVSTLQDGRTIAIHHRPMPDGGWVATHDDITEHREALAEIEHMARHDALTGMPNRVLLRRSPHRRDARRPPSHTR